MFNKGQLFLTLLPDATYDAPRIELGVFCRLRVSEVTITD